MASPSVDDVRRAVGAVVDPELRRTLDELDMIREVDLHDGVAHITVALTIAGCPAADRIETEVREAALAAGSASAQIRLDTMTTEERAAMISRLRPAGRTSPFGPDSTTRIIAVTSGKGGVGKSSLTVNLAVALSQRGLRVGIIDADVYGYSVPALMGLAPAGVPVRPTRLDDMIVPPIAHGVKVISIGMFVDDSSVAVAWRGPMLQRTISQFLSDVYFGDLDVLLIDLPPGTGDAAITVGQLLPHSDVVVVTTPQPYAAGVAIRAGGLAAQTGQRVVGVVENMGDGIDDEGRPLSVFGAGGADAVAIGLQNLGLDAPVLARVPLSPVFARAADAEVPAVMATPDDPAAASIRDLADRLLEVTRRPRVRVGLTPG